MGVSQVSNGKYKGLGHGIELRFTWSIEVEKLKLIDYTCFNYPIEFGDTYGIDRRIR